MIPNYQQVMLPLLNILKDDQAHSVGEIYPSIGKHFNLTVDEMNELLPSKRNKILNNRIHWARAYLKMAGAIDSIDKGKFKITERGKSILSKNIPSLNVKFLMNEFPDFREKINSYRTKKKDDSQRHSTVDDEDEYTPEEQIEAGYQKIRQSVEQEILSKLKSIHPSFFEKIVVELLVKMGYGGSIAEAGHATKYTNDEGIDGIIKEDKLGLDVIYIQAKRWEGIVGRPEIQKFVGALAGQRARKGVFITTSDFSKEATTYASQMDTKIVLIDGEQLAQYMIDYNLGVSIQNTYEIKKMDSDYFEEE
jgi:restriction system protein